MIKLNFDIKMNRKRVACFDLDHTLIKPKSGKTFPVDKNDWTWIYKNVPDRLKELYNDNFNIIIFTNQLGISKNKTNREDIVFKISSIQKELNFPILAYIAFKDDIYRKPRIGCWKDFKNNYKIKINKKESFYVGDMAGRIKNEHFKKDRNDSDRKFARNIKIKFFTPEMFFKNEKEREWIYNNYKLNYINSESNSIINPINKEILLISGYPASGKSTLSSNLISDKFKDYEYFSKDKYGSRILKLIEKSINNNKNIIVEGLLYNYEKRKKYIDIAKQYNYKIRIIEINSDLDLSFHMNIFRSIKTKEDIIPKVVYYTYRKNYQKPNNDFFDKIINYIPNYPNKINKYFLY
jgi:bifunctional polynucleotide phosphatase/kinase